MHLVPRASGSCPGGQYVHRLWVESGTIPSAVHRSQLPSSDDFIESGQPTHCVWLRSGSVPGGQNSQYVPSFAGILPAPQSAHVPFVYERSPGPHGTHVPFWRPVAGGQTEQLEFGGVCEGTNTVSPPYRKSTVANLQPRSSAIRGRAGGPPFLSAPTPHRGAEMVGKNITLPRKSPPQRAIY